MLIKTADTIYVRLHGPDRWYRHDYSDQELTKWAARIRRSRAKDVFVYFNNDYEANAPRNAVALRSLLTPSKSRQSSAEGSSAVRKKQTVSASV